MSAPYSPGHGRILHAGGMTSIAVGWSPTGTSAEMDEEWIARADPERVEGGTGDGDGLDLLRQAHGLIVRLGCGAGWSSSQTRSSPASSTGRSCAARAGAWAPRPAR